MYKLGRKPRAYNTAIPYLSRLTSTKSLPPIPATKDWSVGMDADYGKMLNDKLGDCTCAAYYHAMQIWSFNAGQLEMTAPDSDVLRLYELTCGYDPDDPSTDRGGIEQTVLEYIHHHGLPVADAGLLWRQMQRERHKLLAYFEVDHRSRDDVKRTIAQCGVAYIGFNVPSNVMPDDAPPPKQWAVQDGSSLIGGHAVVLVGYDADWLTFVSWGELFQMNWAFFEAYTDEVYALCDSTWISTTGLSPFGLSLEELREQMAAMTAVARLKALKAQVNAA